MPKIVIVTEGNEKEVSKKLFKMFTRYIELVQRHRASGKYDDKREVIRLEEKAIEFFKNPLINFTDDNS